MLPGPTGEEGGDGKHHAEIPPRVPERGPREKMTGVGMKEGMGTRRERALLILRCLRYTQLSINM